jgi:hypothetical protein
MGDECVGYGDGYHCLDNFTRSVHCLNETVAPNAQGMLVRGGPTLLACACDPDTGLCSAMDFRDPVVIAGLALTIGLMFWLIVTTSRLVARFIHKATMDM